MKRQHLFNSFWPITVAVLATQPAWADTVRVSEVRFNRTASGVEVLLETPKTEMPKTGTPKSATPPVVSISSDGNKLVAEIANTQLRDPQGATFQASLPTDGTIAVTVKPSDTNSIRVTVTGGADVHVGKLVKSDRGLVLLLATSTSDKGKQPIRAQASPSATNRGNTPKSEPLAKQPASARPTPVLLAKQSASARPTPVLLAKQSASARPTPVPLAKQPVSARPTPVLLTKQPASARPTPVVTTPGEATKQPTPTTIPSNIPPGSVGIRGIPAPNYLNPSSNDLQFPTKPEDVRIQGTQPITLEQAVELARRNNRTVQVAELNLRSSRAVLRQAQASEYPQLSLSATLSHSDIGFINSSNGSIASISGLGTSGTGTTTGIGTGTTIGNTTIGNTTTGNTTTGNTTTGNTTTGNTTTGNTTTGNTTTGNTTTGGTTTTTPVTSTGSPNTTTGNTTTGSTTTGNTTTGNTTTGNTTTGNTTTGNTTTGNTTTGNTSTSSTNLTGTLSLSYNLYTSGRRDATIREAERQVRSSELNLEDQVEQLRLDVSNDYYALQQADQQVLIDLAAVTNAQANLRDTIALRDAGVGTQFDVLRSQVQLANTTSNLTNAQAQQQISRRQLAQRLSIAQTIEISAADPVQKAGVWDLSLENSIVQAFKNRADLEAQLVQREINIQQRRVDLATLGPQVSLDARYSLSDQLNNSLNSRGTSDGYSLQATASLLLFDGGQTRAKAAQDDANIAIAETRFADTRNQIRFSVEQAYAQLQSNDANIQTTILALEQSRAALRLARLRFQAGVGTQTDVISSENDLTLAQGNSVTAILNYNRALASIRRAVSNVRSR